MSFLKSLGDTPHLYEVFKKYRYFAIPVFRLHDILMRGEGLSEGERETIFAYVSGLNACSFCTRGHVAAMSLWGMPEKLMDQLMADLDTAAVTPKLRALLKFVKKLTETPGRMVEADAQAVYAAGWSEDELFAAIGIAALAGFMNRIADGTGITAATTKTTIGKVKWKTYTENLLKQGFLWPADQAPPDLSGTVALK